MFKARFYCPLKEHYTLCAMYLCTMMNFMNERLAIEIYTLLIILFFSLLIFALFSCQTSVDYPCAVHLNASVPAYNVCIILFACNFNTHHVRYRLCFITKLLRYLCERQIYHAYLKLNYCRLCIIKDRIYQMCIFGKEWNRIWNISISFFSIQSVISN